MSRTAIEFQHVSKLYRLGRVGTGTLSHDLNRWWQTVVLRHDDPYQRIGEVNDRSRRGQSDYVWALKEVSFEVEQGDVVGIIGRNGAGKSTLLKILSGITAPTKGSIRYEGRIASLLEVGTGFHPEMTGRENIYMNGALLGMTKREIAHKMDEMVDFAGVERYIDTPVKRYSSGMTVRLGFAVAAFLEPEILVVDEVLTVGDAEFQKKAIGKMQDVSRGEGRTVLFVSHNMAAVKGICNRAVLLDNGQLLYQGEVGVAIGQYLSHADRLKGSRIMDHLTWKKDYLTLDTVMLNGSDSAEQDIDSQCRTLSVEMVGHTSEAFDCNLNLKFRDMQGTALATFAPGAYRGELLHVGQGKFHLSFEVTLPSYMSEGDAVVDLWVHRPQIDDFIKLDHCCLLHFAGGIEPCCTPLHLKDDGFCGL